MKWLVVYIGLCVLALGTVMPLFSVGYFPMHDDTQIARVVEMGRALQEGQFPVRWVENLGYGYGYPIFNFYGPLPYYIGGSLYALGMSSLTATKMMFGIGIVLPVFLMFYVAKKYIGIAGALVGALLYIYAPYHAVAVYIRGAVGEYYILIFWPLLLHSFFLASQPGRRASGIVLGSFSLACSVLSHTLLGYVTVVGVIMWLAIAGILRVRHILLPAAVVRGYIGIILGGLALSAFFWLPALTEMGYTNVSSQVSSTAHYADHFVCPIQLWSMAWGFGGSSPGCLSDGISFMLGKLHILLAVIAVIIWKAGLLKVRYKSFFLTAMGITIIGIGMTTEASYAFWKVLPYFSYLQYPWRFLSVAGFGIAILGGYSVLICASRWRRIIVSVVLCVGIIFLYGKRFVPQKTQVLHAHEAESVQDIRWRASRISDEYLPFEIPRPSADTDVRSDAIVSDDPIAVTTIVEKAIYRQYVIESTTGANLQAQIAFFPGWIYRIDGKEIAPDVKNGFPSFTVSSGQSVITMVFQDTPIRTAANLLSIVSCVGIIYIYAFRKKIIS